MKKALTGLSIVLALAAVSPAFARSHQRPAAPYEHVNSGYGPPMTWDEIEVSHPEGG